jgi:ubiquitin fusion degradation protein 1
MNIELNCSTHCGVLDFTGEEDICYLPLHMFNRLCLHEGMAVNIRNVFLEKGKFIKFRPHQTEFVMNPNPKVILENGLRSYVCISKKDTITIQFNKKKYLIDVVECKPKDTISLTNVDIEVDFDTPLDFKEEEHKFTKQPSIVPNEEKKLTEFDIISKIQDEKFKGTGYRVDGKKITENQAKKIESFNKKKNIEESYDPRKHRITHGLRNNFIVFAGTGTKLGLGRK